MLFNDNLGHSVSYNVVFIGLSNTPTGKLFYASGDDDWHSTTTFVHMVG